MLHFREAVGRDVVVGLISGETLAGRLTTAAKGLITLESVLLLNEAQETACAGVVHVLHDKILYLQVTG